MKLDHIAERGRSELSAGAALLAFFFLAGSLAVPYLLN